MQWNDVMLTNEKKNNILNLKVSKKIFLILLIYINFCTCTILVKLNVFFPTIWASNMHVFTSCDMTLQF